MIQMTRCPSCQDRTVLHFVPLLSDIPDLAIEMRSCDQCNAIRPTRIVGRAMRATYGEMIAMVSTWQAQFVPALGFDLGPLGPDTGDLAREIVQGLFVDMFQAVADRGTIPANGSGPGNIGPLVDSLLLS